MAVYIMKVFVAHGIAYTNTSMI